ncbi:MAG: 4-hydroxythreonine-4-phosphate dehydrogenase PdxA [Bacteroidales bacterium]|nr:4-hydroxythreonine-4-phosphate dehydrogenase PdxA [Bacteroidales bacterium]
MKVDSTYKPLLAVTMGDPSGIGPEIVVKTFSNPVLLNKCRPVLIGHAPIMEKVAGILGVKLKFNVIKDVKNALFIPSTMDIFEIGAANAENIEFGKVSPEAGDIAFRAVTTAIELAMNKKVDGTVTGPIHKEAINLAGHHFSGHTEIYAHYTNTKKYAMLLADEDFRVIHVTTHVSLRQACDLIKKQRVEEVITILYDGLVKLGIKDPHIGVAGLNPHSGDGGLFGREEIDEIAPAIEASRIKGFNVEGPVPPDTLFALAHGGKFDGCVAMYHDQGHIPFKLLGFNWDKSTNTMKSVKGVNITLGLPIVRTSVDHGTAFEIAGKGLASPDALMHAIDYAIKLTN